MTSPPSLVIKERRTLADVALKNRTEPSARRMLKPPGWKLPNP